MITAGLRGEEGRGPGGLSAAQHSPGHSREGKSWKGQMAVGASGSFMFIMFFFPLGHGAALGRV